MTRYILAHDLGTTGNKATLYDGDGAFIGSTFFAYNTQYAHPGWAEQNAADWWEAVCTTTHDLLRMTGISPAAVACITFSGQMMGTVPLDANARPLRNAIIWADTRSGAQAAALGEKISKDDIYRITGHRLSASYALHKIQWIREHQPDIYASAHAFMHAKDAIIARLTGQFITEPSDASGMNLYDLARGDWSADILRASGIDADKLPRIVRSIDVVGEVLRDVADEIGLPAGTPVVAGGGDGSCAAVGAGSVAENIMYGYVGSSSWIATTTKAPILDPEQRTFTFGHVMPGYFMPTGTMQAAGASYQWMRDQLAPLEKQAAASLGVSAYDLMNAVAAGSKAGSRGLLYLPYLLGERSPRWNPDARAAFIGLTIRHTRADMLHAAMEGVAFNLRVIIDAFARQGASASAIRMIGGGVSGRFWAQIMASVFGRSILRLQKLEEATSMGAAVVGGVGVGLFSDFSIAARMNAVRDEILPDGASAGVYDDLYAAFNLAYDQLVPVFELLAKAER
ncbi:MAG: FGGY-family carbohydrate kinase [Pleurocapsa minor GSE-CHR-MK-17-07R]|jgi:xylulokinase|nr:FGGY-family carbohydrate kinase [Pleurocapsa minor GSE-CHR-MK 17-07R]